MLDLAALYAERGYIDAESFMEDWDYVYADLSEHCYYFIAERADRSRATTHDWPHFRHLAMKALERRPGKQPSLSKENPV